MTTTRSSGFDAVSITGDVGTAPEVEWKGQLEAEKPETKVLVEGDGETIKDGDKVNVNVWIGNGFLQEKVFTTTTKDGKPELLTVDDQLTPAFKDAMLGQTIGSRRGRDAAAADVFGETGNPEMNIGNKDSVVVVFDLMEMFQPPQAEDVPASLAAEDRRGEGRPGLARLQGHPEARGRRPAAPPRRHQGQGDPTREGTVTADYLGKIYDAKKPFDESFSAEPASFSLAQVVQGWDHGALGSQGRQPGAARDPAGARLRRAGAREHPGQQTLYFVVDIAQRQVAGTRRPGQVGV